ncbi:MAG: Lrp/AsnC family transcriptional regulator [Candidatus ainarchaeum sp.]|nr:Lrp/AsnC family transcriptional regulator [Candidatus ainarchaeum sp.]
MKNIEEKLIGFLSQGYCTPQIAALAKKTGEPATTLHYNIKRMEKEGKVASYKAAFDYSKLGKGFCTYVLLNLSPDEYADPERIAKDLSKFQEIESVDIVTGDWELIVKIRTRDVEEYYAFLRAVLSRKGITKMKSLNSLKQVKSEFVVLD